MSEAFAFTALFTADATMNLELRLHLISQEQYHAEYKYSFDHHATDAIPINININQPY